MRLLQLFAAILFLSLVCLAQAAPQSGVGQPTPSTPAQTPASKPAQATEQQVPPDAPVVKVTGLCSQAAADGNCQTVNGTFNDTQAKELADKIRARATEGEDMTRLQTEVWTTEKAKGTPPKADLGWKRQGALDQRFQPQLANLKPGEVSPALKDAQNYYVYKFAEKKLVPLKEVQKDIAGALQQQMFSEKVKALLDSVKTDLNESYFGAEPEHAKPTPPAEEKPPAPHQ